MNQVNWKNLLIFVLAVALISQLAGYLGTHAARPVSEREPIGTPVQASDQDIRVIASSQDADGVSQNDLNMTFLKKLEMYTVERTKTKIRELPNSPQIDITSEATYVESGPMKFAVIRIRGSDNSHLVFVHGIVGNEFRRVGCMRDSTKAIPVSYGVCGDKIREVFGTKIGA